MGHDGGDRCCCCPSEVILQAGCQWRLVLFVLSDVEIDIVWTRWEEEDGGGEEEERTVCLGIGGEWRKKKRKKKGEKVIYGEREDTRRYGAQVVGQVRVP